MAMVGSSKHLKSLRNKRRCAALVAYDAGDNRRQPQDYMGTLRIRISLK
jgi:hypothetical protein